MGPDPYTLNWKKELDPDDDGFPDEESSIPFGAEDQTHDKDP
jgi:hypothetical protein